MRGGIEMKKATFLVLSVLIILGARFFSPSPGEGAADTRREVDVIASVTVWIELDGKLTALLAISGIGDENEVVEHKITGPRGENLIQKIPGRVKISNIVIKKYVTPPANDLLYLWRRGVVDGRIIRKNGAIVFLDANMKEVARYNFYNAWPSQWKGITLGGQSPFAEEIMLSVDKIERVR